MKKYSPRRASKRWLANAPAHVLDCIQHSPGHWSVLYWKPGWDEIGGREMDSRPTHPQGLGMWFSLPFHQAAAYRYRMGKRRVTWESLPDEVKACVIDDGKDDA